MFTSFFNALKCLSLLTMSLVFFSSPPLQAMMVDENFEQNKRKITSLSYPGVYEDIMQSTRLEESGFLPKGLTIDDANLVFHYMSKENSQQKSSILRLSKENGFYEIIFIHNCEFQYTLHAYENPPMEDDLFKYLLAWHFISEQNYDEAQPLFHAVSNGTQLTASLKNEASAYDAILSDPNELQEFLNQ